MVYRKLSFVPFLFPFAFGCVSALFTQLWYVRGRFTFQTQDEKHTDRHGNTYFEIVLPLILQNFSNLIL